MSNNRSKQRYNTKQEGLIISFFENNKSGHFTADEVCDNIRCSGISRATIYRRLERLVEDGVLIKFSFDGKSSACFKYCSDGHSGSGTCHFICTKCKNVQHIDCHLLEGLQSHLFCDHNLNIDSTRTVFYGVCGGCVCKN